MKNGFAVLKSVLGLALIGLIVFGGYSAYLYFTDESFDFYGLMDRGPSAEEFAAMYPSFAPNLTEHVLGANADFLLFYKKDQDFIDYIQPVYDLPDAPELPFYPNDVLSVMVAAKIELPENMTSLDFTDSSAMEELSDAAGLIVAVEFSDNEMAQKAENMALSLVAFFPNMRLDVYDNVFVAHDNPDVLEGNVEDNPLLAKIDPIQGPSADFVALFDTGSNPVYTLLPFALVNTVVGGMGMNFDASVPSAHAQLIAPSDQPGRLVESTGGEGSMRQMLLTGLNFLLGASNHIGLYATFDDPNYALALNMEIMDKDQLGERMEAMAESVEGDVSASELMDGLGQAAEAYDESLTMIDEGIAEFRGTVPGLSIERDGTNLSLLYEGVAPNLEMLLAEGEARSKDAVRLANINSLVAGIEAYNADNGEYPQYSSCIQFAGIDDYFPRGELPEDPNGPQTFTTVPTPSMESSFAVVECDSGYYYQFFGDSDYALWAKMEDEENGNHAMFVNDRADFATSESGQYYVWTSIQNPGEPGKSVSKLDLIFPDEEEGARAETTSGVSRGVPRSVE